MGIWIDRSGAPVSTMDRARGLAARLLGSRPEYDVYGQLLHQLHGLSVALDREIERSRLPILRSAASGQATLRLQAELRGCGADGLQTPPLLEARSMIRRYESLSREEPLLLLAHHHARVLREPGGPTVVGRLAASILDGGETEGILQGPADPVDSFFDAIGRLGLPVLLVRRLKNEAIRAQAMNQRLVREFYQDAMLV